MEKARRRALMGSLSVDDVGEEADSDFSVVELAMLPWDSDRSLVSARTSSRLTLSREYGVVLVSRISTNLEAAIDYAGVLIFDSWWIARTREEEEGRQVDQVQQEDGIGAHKREYIDGKNICMCRSIGLDPIVEPWTGRAASVANHVPACQRPAPVRSHDDPCGRTPRPIRDPRARSGSWETTLTKRTTSLRQTLPT